MTDAQVRAILENTQVVLRTAELGLADLGGDDPSRRLSGLHNVVVFGRAVTNVLQKLRGPLGEEFDEWYVPRREEMERDKLMQFFYKLRSDILKEGKNPTTVTTHIESLNTADIARIPQPPGAKAFFMGDRLGGNGWEVELPDGTTEKYYVSLPPEIRATTTINFEKSIRRHLGKRPEDQSAAGLSRLYIGYLRDLVAGAKQRFG